MSIAFCSRNLVFGGRSALRKGPPVFTSRSSPRLRLQQPIVCHHSYQAGTKTRSRKGAAIAVVSTVASIYALCRPRTALAEESQKPRHLIRLHEIHEHNRSSDTYWVFRGDRVYDITEWIPNHPGGEVILRAAGGNIQPYWEIFTIHQKDYVYEILEQYFIGNIDPQDLVDGRAPVGHVDDPFTSDPIRNDSLIARSDRPCNAETPKQALSTFITPNDMFYVRNHLWVPETGNGDQHRLTIEMMDGTEIEYTMSDLRRKFKEYRVTATMQCSGNRRAHMTAGSRATNGLQWDIGAISNAEWTGVRLRDVLKDAGLGVDELPEGARHAQFVGAEAYGASIPIEKAVDSRGDVLLAYEMNGEPLPRDHGFPLRVIVPGHVAARSVKWVNKIMVSNEESTSQWQRRDYKCFGPNEGKTPDWDRAVSIQEMPVQSAIVSISKVAMDRLKNSRLAQVYGLEEDSIVLQGYAFAGGGRKIVRVDVSPDNGRTWQQAELPHHDARGTKTWTWSQWRIAFARRDIQETFLVKAVDESYNTQPDSFTAHYNFRGNLTSGWHRVEASVLEES